MNTTEKIKIAIETTVNVSIEKAWKTWTEPAHIVNWNFASPDWHTTKAEADLRAGGKFSSRMEAKDGSFGFDFAGVFDVVKPNEYIEYTMGDGRKTWITFSKKDNATHIEEVFEAETENSIELQRGGWQAILDNYKKYTESI